MCLCENVLKPNVIEGTDMLSHILGYSRGFPVLTEYQYISFCKNGVKLVEDYQESRVLGLLLVYYLYVIWMWKHFVFNEIGSIIFIIMWMYECITW